MYLHHDCLQKGTQAEWEDPYLMQYLIFSYREKTTPEW